MLLEISETVGTSAFAISGYYIALRHRLDLLGIFVVSFVTALGGGIIRDLIADKTPVTLTQTLPSLIVFITVTVSVLMRFGRESEPESKKIFIFVDAVGMVSFAISGAYAGLDARYNIAEVSLLAFITAVGGGMIRDILLNEVPYVLKGGFYGIIALGIGIIMSLSDMFGILNALVVTFVFIFSIVLRLYAYKKGWNLPIL